MSTTTTLIATAAPGLQAPPQLSTTSSSCPACGTAAPRLSDFSEDAAQSRIVELENQVRLLTEKASTAVDKLADYEDELRHLRALQANRTAAEPSAALHTAAATPSGDGNRPHTANPAGSGSRSSRITSLLGRRKSSNSISAAFQSAGSVPPLPGAPQQEAELRIALEKERNLRQEAEGKVSAMSTEIEELSVTLFQQANEMVAEERKARAKLEERVEMLEKRDKDKRRRLERLENAVQRIERVRGLLAP
ncbi:putative ribosomal protein l32 protein [Neofusicoccum parvum UCRNP2]|uniref:Putative ribosomal protein l32 protein n=1 Tax=Botryosphaeria parva (strain UCR-NP2) TaxID=1287680 RepID=R1GUG5_BOTPV|nr:putative ribosomal protein l32 protein [Neofusicoccum parvum UCRNP2]